MSEGTQHTPQLKVLIVDDDIPTRILLKAALSQWGYEVIEAGDGEEAWEILKSPNPPPLLISDWVMPKLDGVGLCERIKNELKTPPYIILLTQMSGTANIVRGLEAGADEFLAKPFNMAELRSRLSVGLRIINYEKTLSQVNSSSETPIKQQEFISYIEKNAKQLGGRVVMSHPDSKHVQLTIDLPIGLQDKSS